MPVDTICQPAACSRLQPVEVPAVGRKLASMPSYGAGCTYSAGHSLPQPSMPVMFPVSAGQSQQIHAPTKLRYQPSHIDGLHSGAPDKAQASRPNPRQRHGTTITCLCHCVTHRSRIHATTSSSPSPRSQRCVLHCGMILWSSSTASHWNLQIFTRQENVWISILLDTI